MVPLLNGFRRKENVRRKLRGVQNPRRQSNIEDYFVRTYLDKGELTVDSPPSPVGHTEELQSVNSPVDHSMNTIIKTPEINTNKHANIATFVYKEDSKHDITSQNQIEVTSDGQISPNFVTYEASESGGTKDFHFDPSH